MSRIQSKSSIENIPIYFRGQYLRPHPVGIFGKPDFANKKRKLAVFIDGCFWHGCPVHFKLPKSNCNFWRNKINNNRKRDRKVTKTLNRDGWVVVRIWEHEL